MSREQPRYPAGDARLRTASNRPVMQTLYRQRARDLVPGGGATASRVELEADVVARAGDSRRVRAAIRKVHAALETLEP